MAVGDLNADSGSLDGVVTSICESSSRLRFFSEVGLSGLREPWVIENAEKTAPKKNVMIRILFDEAHADTNGCMIARDPLRNLGEFGKDIVMGI